MEGTIKIFRRKLVEYGFELTEDEEKTLRLKIQKPLNEFLKKKIGDV